MVLSFNLRTENGCFYSRRGGAIFSDVKWRKLLLEVIKSTGDRLSQRARLFNVDNVATAKLDSSSSKCVDCVRVLFLFLFILCVYYIEFMCSFILKEKTNFCYLYWKLGKFVCSCPKLKRNYLGIWMLLEGCLGILMEFKLTKEKGIV